MNRTLALAISTVFHPVFVNLAGLLYLLFLSPYLSLTLSPRAQLFYALFIFISAGVVPIVVVLGLKLFGKVQSVLLDVQEERNIPYLITAAIYLFDFYFFSRVHTPSMIRAYLLACACIVVAVVLINHFYKISVHGAALGSLAGILMSHGTESWLDIRLALAVVIIVSGITLSARLFLYAHQLSQVIWGWLLGFAIMLLVL